MAFTGSLGIFLLLHAFRVVLGLPAADKHSARKGNYADRGKKSHFFLSFLEEMTHEEANKILKLKCQ